MLPAYPAIIGMGETALPFILDEMLQRGGHWYWALRIAGKTGPGSMIFSVAEWMDAVPAILKVVSGTGRWKCHRGGAVWPRQPQRSTAGYDLQNGERHPRDEVLPRRRQAGELYRGHEGRLPASAPGDDEVVFPFGFGLSYSQFELLDVALDRDVVATVSNRSERAGSTVVEVYRERSQPDNDDPWRELVAFRKVPLQSGETKVVRLPLAAAVRETWDLATGSWCLDPGINSVWVTLDGLSGRNVPLPSQEKDR